jgi:hypothetical protein
MRPVPDRKQRRREYLRLKAGIQLKVWGSTAWVGFNATLLLVSCVATLLCGWLSIVSRAIYWPVMLPGPLVALMCAMWVKPSLHAMRSARRTRSKLRYIPPVTADALAAEEVLVRSSEEPAAPQDRVLLRAAQGQETPTEELLRIAGHEG